MIRTVLLVLSDEACVLEAGHAEFATLVEAADGQTVPQHLV